MQLFRSYSDAYKCVFSTQTYTAAHLRSIRLPMNIDTTGCYKIFYFNSGNKKFHIENRIYDVKAGDLFLINPKEWHYFSNIANEEEHERFVFFIYPDYLKALSSEDSDLSTCFSHDKLGSTHLLHLSDMEQKHLLALIDRMSESGKFGQELMDMSTILELLIIVNRLYINSRADMNSTNMEQVSNFVVSKQVRKVLAYIDEYITEDLTLAVLSNHFFMNSSYLCRVFKSETGTTIHKHITAKRITLAKELLSQGYSVTDSCRLSGFKDYNGFLKSFVAAVGVSPKNMVSLKNRLFYVALVCFYCGLNNVDRSNI